MKVGGIFHFRFEDPGEFLADVHAMETAGIDSVWMREQHDGYDPWFMLAAIAAVTSKLRLGLITESPSPLAAEGHGKSPSPLAREGQGRGFDERRLATLQLLSRNRVIESSTESWQRVDVPSDRDAWAATLERAERDGAHGVLVPLDPRLLDILRHPDDAIDRSDLILAQG